MFVAFIQGIYVNNDLLEEGMSFYFMTNHV